MKKTITYQTEAPAPARTKQKLLHVQFKYFEAQLELMLDAKISF
jgi:hypothetical protein